MRWRFLVAAVGAALGHKPNAVDTCIDTACLALEIDGAASARLLAADSGPLG